MTPQRLAAGVAFALGVWDGIWYAALHPPTAIAPPLGAALLAAPLLFCVPAAARGTPLALGVAGFLAIGYLAHGLTEFVANPPERAAAGVACALALLLMVISMHALRARRHAAR